MSVTSAMVLFGLFPLHIQNVVRGHDRSRITSRPCWFATAWVQVRDPSSTRQEQTVGAPVASIPRRVLDEHHLPSSLPVSIYKYNRVLAADAAPWCLVFDNVESHGAVIQHRPTGGNGKTLVTSRNSISVAEADAIACRSGKKKQGPGSAQIGNFWTMKRGKH